MAYYKKFIIFLIITSLFILIYNTTCFAVTITLPNNTSYNLPDPIMSNIITTNNTVIGSAYEQINNYLICKNSNNWSLLIFPDDLGSNKVVYDGSWIKISNGSSYQSISYYHCWLYNNDTQWNCQLFGNYSNYTDVVYSSVDVYSDVSASNLYLQANATSPTTPLSISFASASSNLTGIAQGTDGSIEIEIFNYNVDEMPDTLYLNIYKKAGNNYNIYSIPIYIYNQFPTYVIQAPLNEDLFLFVNKSKLYSMGINFQSSDEFYLFLSNDVAPKGYTTWNNDGTGILLGNSFETTSATIFDESGLITIPTLTTEQEQSNQNQADTQKQIDAINQQTQVQQDTNDFIKNENINDDNISLPSMDTNDITEDGIGNIFTAIYNGLTNGQAKDIVLPFPFTNKTITIPANYTEQFLTTSAFSPIYLIIQSFYWYIISRYIIKDVASKFEKIKSGNIENLENNNIKTEML